MFYKKSNLGEFDTKYSNLKLVALETLNKLQKGYYENENNQKVNIEDMISYCIQNTRAYEQNYKYSKPKKPATKNSNNIEISLETTIGAGYRLVVQEGFEKTVVLNFANPFEPGGGWLRGAPTQEESIIRCSSLISSLTQSINGEFNEELKTKDIIINGKKYKNPVNFYLHNLEIEPPKNMLASDYMILSPDVPVFRDDRYNFLPQPFNLSVITSPAVLKKYYLQKTTNEKKDNKIINQAMLERIRKIILLAIQEGYDAIVLGAYGCGAFGNDSKDVSKMFKDVLVNEGLQNYFKKITFAIFSPRNKTTIQDFCDTFQLQPI